MVEEKEENKKIKLPKLNIWMVSTLVLAIAVGFLFYRGSVTGRFVQSELTKEEAAQKVIDYINNNLVQPGTKASLVKVEEFNGLYKITTSYQGQQIPVYVTKDGKYLFISQPIDTSQELLKEQTEEQPQKIPKTDKPEAHAFIMSYCPYGLQFLKAYIPVIELLGDKADLQINFVHYAMHGEKELIENTRIYCIQKEYKEKLTKYLRCFVETDNPEKCMSEAEIDKNSVEKCMNDTDKEFRITEKYNDKSTWLNGRYPPYDVDAVLANRYDVRGSPTFIVNGQTVSVSRSPEAIKQIICSAFNNPPSECNQKLSETVEQPGIGPIGTSSGASSSGQC